MVLKIKHSTSPNYKKDPKKTENYNQALNGHLRQWTPTTAGAAKPGESHLAAEELQHMVTLHKPAPRSTLPDASSSTGAHQQQPRRRREDTASITTFL